MSATAYSTSASLITQIYKNTNQNIIKYIINIQHTPRRQSANTVTIGPKSDSWVGKPSMPMPHYNTQLTYCQATIRLTQRTHTEP